MRWFLPVLVALLLVAPPAHAFTAISSAIVGWLGGAAAIGSVGVALVQVGVGLVGSALARALSPKPKAPERAGIRTEVTTEGDVTPQTIVLGRYATAGNLVAPYYSFDSDRIASGDYRVAIYDLGDLPIDGLDAILINGTRLALDTHFAAADTTMAVNAPETGAVTANLGRTVKTGVGRDRYAGKVFIRWHDGNQTVADPTLRALFGAHPERPWTSTMIGRGVPYAIVIYKLDDEVWQSEPQARFVVRGAKFLDPRTATTGWTENPMVMTRAILSGVAMPDGQSYGMGVADADLPADWWDPAMNACDPDGNGRRYIAGYEARIANPDVGGDAPLSVVEELLKAAGAEICDMGGTWITRVGGPGLPVASLTDDDILRTEGQSFDPFPGMSDTYNAVTATFPSPAAGWNPKQSPVRVDAAAETADGERLIADLQLPAAPSAPQVQWLLQDWLRDARRMRRHTISLPPEYTELTPLDAVSWTSARNGYTDKLFAVEELAIDPRTLSVTMALREQDPADYTRQDGTILPEVDPSTVVVQPQARTVPGFGASPTTVADGAGTDRRPAIQAVWSTEQPGVRGVRVAVRVQATGQQVVTAFYATSDGGAVISQGIVPGVTYEVRARPVLDAPTAWTGWQVVTTPDVRFGPDELSDAVWSAVDGRADDVANALLGDFDRGRLGPLLGDYDADQALRGLRDVLVSQQQRSEVNAAVYVAREDFTSQVADARSVIATTRNQLGAAVDRANALIENERSTRASTDQAQAAQITTLQADLTAAESDISASATAISALDTRVTDNEGALSSQATSLTSLDSRVGTNETSIGQIITTQDGIRAEYAVRVNNNGHISGFGLISDLMAGNPTSDFVVVADRFFLIAPDGTQQASPFYVLTSPTVIDGVTVPAGAYIDKAAIREALIDTLEIKGQAVTVPVRAFSNPYPSYVTISSQTEVDLISVTINRQGFATDIDFSCNLDGLGSGTCVFRVYRDGVLVRESAGLTGPDGRQKSIAWSTVDYDTGTGSATFTIRAAKNDPAVTGGWDADVRVIRLYLKAQQVKR